MTFYNSSFNVFSCKYSWKEKYELSRYKNTAKFPDNLESVFYILL